MAPKQIWYILIVLGVLLSVFWSYKHRNIKESDQIAVLEISGVIESAIPYLSDLKFYEDDAGVKALVLRINSPGGAVAPSQEIYEEILKFRKKKKVVASLGTVAASGAYYIASAADRIVANPGTLTGSIGVIIQFPMLKDLFEKLGMDFAVLKSGKYKDVGSSHRKMTEEEKGIMQDTIDDTYSQFFTDVREARGLDSTALSKIADGRVFTGRFARDAGLVDELGNFFKAVDVAKKLAGIQGTAKLVTRQKDLMPFPYKLLRGFMGAFGGVFDWDEGTVLPFRSSFVHLRYQLADQWR